MVQRFTHAHPSVRTIRYIIRKKKEKLRVEPANAFHVKKPAEMVDLLRPPTDEETATFFSSLNPSVPAKLDVRADAYGGKGVFVKRGCTIAQGDVS